MSVTLISVSHDTIASNMLISNSSLAWVCSENMSEKSEHQSGISVSEKALCWAIWVEMVILLMDLFSFHSSHFLSCLLIFALASMPSQHTRYCWGRKVVSVVRGSSGSATVFFLQSMVGFHFFSQGIPRMICFHPRLRTMSLSFSVFCLNRMLVWAFHWMVSLALVIPSILLAMMGWGSFSRGNLRRQRRPTSMKFLNAPRSMRAVVLMVCVPLDSLMGICMVLSFGRAVITWFTTREEYVNSSFQAKNPQVLWRLCSQGGLHNIISGFGGLQLCPYPELSGFEHALQWWRLGR